MFKIQIGVEDRRGRISWKLRRHTDGAKPVMEFVKRRQALAHIRHSVFYERIRLIHPDGAVEPLMRCSDGNVNRVLPFVAARQL